MAAYGLLIVALVLPPLLVGGTMSIGRMTVFAIGQGFAATLFFTWCPLF